MMTININPNSPFLWQIHHTCNYATYKKAPSVFQYDTNSCYHTEHIEYVYVTQSSGVLKLEENYQFRR